MKNKISVGVIGASGYSGEELLRLLFKHPNVVLKFVTSRQYAGESISSVYPRFSESEMFFCQPNIDKLASQVEFCFLALPHGLASEYALPLLEKGVRVIDISADFRLVDDELYLQYYGLESPRKKIKQKPIYGAPERNRQEIKSANLIACPGCYPTSSVLPLYPLLKAGVIEKNGITIFSMSGVTGAGRTAKIPFIFPECNESARPYGVIGHRHLPEIEQELAEALGGDNDFNINFIPHLIPLNRGIHSTIIAKCKSTISEEELYKILKDAYQDEFFVRVLPLGKLADIKDVSWSNFCEIGLCFDEKTGNVILSSSIDNLVKGAAGQAVQCFNIMANLEEIIALS